METQASDQVLHGIQKNSSSFSPIILLIFLVVIVAGISVGYFLIKKAPAVLSTTSSTSTTSNAAKGTVFGSNDTATFKDMAEGKVTAGGIEGEGQYHLVRPGGDSQNVYMTSSLVDLSQFIGKQVKVWGQTQKARSAGWLMDVGRVEIE